MLITSCIVWATFTVGVFVVKYQPDKEEIIQSPQNEVVVVNDEKEVDGEAQIQTFFREDVPLSYELQKALYDTANSYGLKYELVLAVIRKETNFQNIQGDKGQSYGYMQINKKWHVSRMERLGVTDLNDPEQNFLVGCDFLSELIDKYGDLEDALTYYNSGSTGESTYSDMVLTYMSEFSATKI